MRRILAIIFIMLAVAISAFSQGKPVATATSSFVADHTEWDFGKIKETKGKVTHTFTLTNRTKKPALINHAIAYCSCTTVSYDKRPVPPGKTTSIKVTYNPEGHKGVFRKEITIRTDNNKQMFKLRIKGEVKQ